MASIENDTDISDLLASGGKEVLSKVPGLVQRFREDHDSKLGVFQDLVASVSSLFSQPTPYATAVPAPPATNIALPTTLQNLQEYVPLLRTLLGISEQEAIRILAIKNVTEDAGSVPFLLDCVDICFHQRAARIAAIAELIPTNASNNLLDVIDQCTTTSRGSPRGLFRMIVSSACQPDPPAIPMIRRPTSVTTDADWNAFLRFARERQVAGRNLERFEALNALLVLLYDNMEVESVDFAILLAAFLEEQSDNKLKNIVSLILVESVALWRTLVDADENTGPLLESHPLLKGAASTDELRALIDVMQQNHRPGWELATLSLGLLLHASKGPLSNEGWLLAKWANSELDAFTILHDVMREMVIPVQATPGFSVEPLLPLGVDLRSTDLENSEELNSSVLAATIGREVLSSVLIAFQGVILPETKLPPIDDLNRIATTAVVIFQNSPTLCKQFWDSWNTSPDRPLGCLLKACWRLASQATESAKAGFRDRDELLRAMSPLLQLLSALVSDPETFQAVLPTFLPPDIIRYAIDLLKFPSQSETMQSTRRKLFNSMATLSKIGCSDKECREQLRSALEYSFDSAASPSGPLALADTFRASDVGAVSSIFILLSNLVHDAPEKWIVDSMGAIKRVRDHQSLWNASFESSETLLPFAKLVISLVRRLDQVSFECSLDNAVVEALLDTMQFSVQSLAATLVSCGHNNSEHELATLIMDGISLTLGHAHSIAQFHRSSSVRVKAIEFMDGMLNILAFKVGTNVFHYAVFPVLVSMLEELDSLDPLHTMVGTVSIFESHGGALPSNGTPKTNIQLKQIMGNFAIDNMVESDGRSRYIACKAGAVQPALSSLRLLNAWVRTLNAGLELDKSYATLTEENLTALPVSWLTTGSVVPPAAAKPNRVLGSNWNSYQIPMAALLIAYVKPTSSAVSYTFASEMLSFLASALSQLSLIDPIRTTQYIAEVLLALDHFGGYTVAFSKTLEAGIRQQSTKNDVDVKNEKIVAVRFLILANLFSRFVPFQCSKRLGQNLEYFFKSIHADVVEAIQQSTLDPLDLDFVKESIRFVQHLWEYERSGHSARGQLIPLISDDSTLFQNILHIALERHDTGRSADPKHQALLVAKLSLIAIIFDILAKEMHWISSRPTDDSNMKAFVSTLSGFLPSETRLVESTKYYNKPQDLLSCFEEFSTISGQTVALLGDMCLSRFVTIVSAQTTRHSALGPSVDPFFEKLFDHVRNPSVMTILSNYDMVDAQQQSLQSWTRFLFAFQNLIRADGIFKPVWGEGDVFQRIFSLLLDALPLDCPTTMSLEYFARVDATMRQLIMLFEHKMDFDCSQLCRGLEALTAVMDSLLIFRADNRKICRTISCVAACGSYLMRKVPLCSSDRKAKELGLACIDVAKSVCAVMQLIWSSAGSISGCEATSQRQLLDQAVTLLLQIMLNANEADTTNSVLRKLCLVFKESSLLQTVSSMAAKVQSLHAHECIICLWIALVQSNDDHAVELLSGNRSYISLVLVDQWTTKDTATLLLSMKFIACSLRQCNLMPRFKESFVSVATSFIASHKDRLLGIVHQASSIDFQQRLLDLQLLEEAKQILCLLSLYCAESRRSASPTPLDNSLLLGLKEQASSLVSVLSTYLGAACSARTLFRAIGNQTEPDNLHEYDPFHRMLQLGTTSTKRTATALCKEFVREKTTKLKTAFTPQSATILSSWENILRDEGTEDNWSDEEKRCIIAVANDCVFELESAVADCLCESLRFLWALHPARDSFVMYTIDEMAKVNTSRIIHAGSIVAFRSPFGQVLRGKVVHCDDLNLQWKIEAFTGKQLATYTIGKLQLMGIQERSRLVNFFQFGPAPETSGDCWRILSTPSLGHLLLTARWCRQYEEELRKFPGPTNEYETGLQNLTEMLSVFIAEEASLHHESQHLIKRNALQHVKCQILDLFGESEDFKDFGVDSLRKNASLEFCSTKVWQLTRQRLFPYLRNRECS